MVSGTKCLWSSFLSVTIDRFPENGGLGKVYLSSDTMEPEYVCCVMHMLVVYDGWLQHTHDQLLPPVQTSSFPITQLENFVVF